MGNNFMKLPHFHVILAATNGDTDAIDMLLSHYEGYISKLSTRTIVDKDGNKHSYVDSEMRNRLRVRLIVGTLNFRIA